MLPLYIRDDFFENLPKVSNLRKVISSLFRSALIFPSNQCFYSIYFNYQENTEIELARKFRIIIVNAKKSLICISLFEKIYIQRNERNVAIEIFDIIVSIDSCIIFRYSHIRVVGNIKQYAIAGTTRKPEAKHCNKNIYSR